jgi:hypothetical protein
LPYYKLKKGKNQKSNIKISKSIYEIPSYSNPPSHSPLSLSLSKKKKKKHKKYPFYDIKSFREIEER